MVERWFELIDNGDVAGFGEVLTSDFVFHFPGGAQQARGLEEMRNLAKRGVEDAQTGAPAWSMYAPQVIAAARRIAQRANRRRFDIGVLLVLGLGAAPVPGAQSSDATPAARILAANEQLLSQGKVDRLDLFFSADSSKAS